MLSVFILPVMAFADDHGDVPVPAIVIEDAPEQVEDIDWTYRFLIPTTVAIATLNAMLTLMCQHLLNKTYVIETITKR